MTGDELRAFRKERGWSQRQLGELISRGLDKAWKEPNSMVSTWERGRREIPGDVETFLAAIELDGGDGPPIGMEATGPFGFPPGDADTPPPAPPGAEQGGLPLLPGGAHLYAKICEEFFEIGATGCGLLAEVIDSENLRRDRDVLLRDKENLGKVWGRLAEKNETFRRMITGGPTDAAIYLQIVLVTGATANRIARNHRNQPAVETAAPQPEREPEGRMYGDGAVIDLPV